MYRNLVDVYLNRIVQVAHLPQSAFDDALQALSSLKAQGYGVDITHGSNILLDTQKSTFNFIDVSPPLDRMLYRNHDINLEHFFSSLAGRDAVHTWKLLHEPEDKAALKSSLQRILHKLDSAAQAVNMKWRVSNEGAIAINPADTPSGKHLDDAMISCAHIIQDFKLRIKG